MLGRASPIAALPHPLLVPLSVLGSAQWGISGPAAPAFADPSKWCILVPIKYLLRRLGVPAFLSLAQESRAEQMPILALLHVSLGSKLHSSGQSHSQGALLADQSASQGKAA